MLEGVYIVDVEGNGLEPTMLHVLSAKEVGTGEVHSTNDYDKMREFLLGAKVIIGHNFTRWDAPVLERILEIKIPGEIVDTLALSWYLYPDRNVHGLEAWGEELGIEKPKVDDWHNLTYEDYKHRCEHDVLINERLWIKMQGYLLHIYEDDRTLKEFLKYIEFKMKCARLAEESRWRLDIERTKRNILELSEIRDARATELMGVMPKVPEYATKVPPKKPRKKDGSLSSTGISWVGVCNAAGVDPWTTEEVSVIQGWKDPNPNSHPQLKDWLFSLGWIPCTFKQNEKGKEVPQISDLQDKSKLTPSVERLKDIEPAVEALEGYFLLNHRLSILNGFLDNVDENGYIKASVQGFTNTLRFRHSVLVNLPGVGSPYGEHIRGVLIAPEGYELCGSDMASLEDRTKQHYIYPHDSKYVEEMNTPDFDPHLDLAELAGMMGRDAVLAYKDGVKNKTHIPPELKGIRHKAKTTNYTCTYGAFPPKIARTAGIPLEEAQELHATYWKRNWAIKAVADEQEVKSVDGQKWLKNPVNGFYYSLRHEKDRFSTLNQGTGSYCFDVWISCVLKRREQITAQFHDEGVFTIRKGYRKEMEKLLQDSIEEANSLLRLNRRLDIGVEFGDTYAEIH